MLIDLKAHYLDLIVRCIEMAKFSALHQPIDQQRGFIYVTPSQTETKALMVMAYSFDTEGCSFKIEFNDQRAPVVESRKYVAGLSPFIAKLGTALLGNRLEDKKAA